MTVVVLFFPLVSFLEVSHMMVFNEATSAIHRVALCSLFSFFPTEFFGVLMRDVLVVVFAQGGVLSNPS